MYLFQFLAGLAVILNLTTTAEGQQHHFTNPNVSVTVTDTYLIIRTDGYPDHRWQRVNPNTPQKQNYNFKIPRNPKPASRTTSVPSRGPIGVAVNGVVFFGPEDAEGKIALENHGLDSCRGHPAPNGVYHYHSTPGCVYRDTPGTHSPVIGYAFDGFKIYGQQGENGSAPRDLDRCNGHTDSQRGYHYHTTKNFPFVLGCYRGTPETANYDSAQRRGFQRGGERGMSRSREGGDPRVSCESDRKKYCPNMPPTREFHECMRRNENNFSRECRDALRRSGPPPGHHPGARR